MDDLSQVLKVKAPDIGDFTDVPVSDEPYDKRQDLDSRFFLRAIKSEYKPQVNR